MDAAVSCDGESYAGDSAGHFASQRVSRATLAWIMVAQGVAIAPLFHFLPLWLMLIWLVAIITRVQIYRGIWPYPTNIVKLTFGIAGAFGLYWSYGRFGVEPMIGFMLVSFVLKLIEVRNRSDVLIVLYIAFVAIATQLLLSQSVGMSLYSLLSCIVVFAALGAVFRYRRISVTRQLIASGVLVLKSLPLMVIMFLVMPRLGQLWAVPSLTGATHTGFSEEMTPGDFTNLVKSDELAFRVSFKDGKLPPRSELYWRGLVLERFDGKSWSRRGGQWLPVNAGAEPAIKPHPHWQLEIPDSENGLSETIPVAIADAENSATRSHWKLATGNNHKKSYRYSILVEPHNYQWLFSLMAPVKAVADREILFVDPAAIVLPTKLSSRLQYTVESVHQYRFNAENKSQNSASGLSHNLILPKGFNERSQALAKQWRDSGKNDEQIIQSALQLFHQSFTYTLRPPLLTEDAVDEFLFETQRGFCEHFASSFAVLMRAANIPSRVIVGYLGGEYNQERGYLNVRQSDAHAWAEIWLPESGWIRVDPTAAVSPERIEGSLLDIVSAEEEPLVGGALMRVGALLWVAKIRYKLEEWDYLWQLRVLGYNENAKNSFFKKIFGVVDSWKLGAFFIASITLFFLMHYFVNFLFRPRPIKAPEQLLIERLLRHMEKRGFYRYRHETLQKYSWRIGVDNPQHQKNMARIARLYNRIAYEGRSDLVPLLKQSIKKIVRNI